MQQTRTAEHNNKNTNKNKNNDENDYDDDNHIHGCNEISMAMAMWSSEINKKSKIESLISITIALLMIIMTAIRMMMIM